MERVAWCTDIPTGVILSELATVHYILTASGDIATRMSEDVELTTKDSHLAWKTIKLNILQFTSNGGIVDVELMSVAPQRTVNNHIVQNDRTSAGTGATSVTICSTLYMSVAQRKRFTHYVVLDIEVGAHIIPTQIHRTLRLCDKDITQTWNVFCQHDIRVFFSRIIDGRLQHCGGVACID